MTIESLKEIQDKLRFERMKNNRIMWTVNNKESSRSHLFIIIEVTTPTNSGFITIVDLAGSENPYDIMRDEINALGIDNFDIIAFLSGLDVFAKAVISKKGAIEKNKAISELINQLKKIDKDQTLARYDRIVRLLTQGFFINESLNHMKYYFNQHKVPEQIKNIASRKLLALDMRNKEYQIHKVFLNPESLLLNNPSSIGDIPKTTFQMIPILNYLKNLDTIYNKSTSKKLTKFVMVCAIRQEENRCTDVINTLDFAQSVSSKNDY